MIIIIIINLHHDASFQSRNTKVTLCWYISEYNLYLLPGARAKNTVSHRDHHCRVLGPTDLWNYSLTCSANCYTFAHIVILLLLWLAALFCSGMKQFDASGMTCLFQGIGVAWNSMKTASPVPRPLNGSTSISLTIQTSAKPSQENRPPSFSGKYLIEFLMEIFSGNNQFSNNFQLWQ